MKIQIVKTDDDNIFTARDYSDVKDTGEVAHFICELESIKQDLLEIWDELQDNKCKGKK